MGLTTRLRSDTCFLAPAGPRPTGVRSAAGTRTGTWRPCAPPRTLQLSTRAHTRSPGRHVDMLIRGVGQVAPGLPEADVMLGEPTCCQLAVLWMLLLIDCQAVSRAVKGSAFGTNRRRGPVHPRVTGSAAGQGPAGAPSPPRPPLPPHPPPPPARPAAHGTRAARSSRSLGKAEAV